MELAEQLAMVGLVILLLVGLMWFLRSRGLASVAFPGMTKGSARQMQLIERLPLTPSHSLHLVKLRDRVLLIGVAPSGCTLLDSGQADKSLQTFAGDRL